MNILGFSKYVIAVGFTVTASIASAATANFDFRSTGINGQVTDESSWTFLSDTPGITVDVTGAYYTIGGGGAFNAGGAIDVENNAWGLISDNSWLDSHYIDSRGQDEAMIFDFGSDMTITNIIISYTSGAGHYDVFMDGIWNGNTSGGSVVPAGPGQIFAIGTRTLYETGSYSCKKWRWAYTRSGRKYKQYYWTTCYYKKRIESGIKISGITVEYETPEVPLPAAGWLMIAGLGGLAALRRRSSAS